MAQYIQYGETQLPFNNLELISIDDSNKEQVIIGTIETRLGIVLFSTNNSGVDCIWEIENIKNEPDNIKLLYCRDLNFSVSNPINGIYNYENEIIQKIYWIDGVNQLRTINIRQSIDNGDEIDLIDLSVSSLDAVPGFLISNPEIESINSSGSIPEGTIQYAYQLYGLNGSKSILSPLTEFVYINPTDTLRSVTIKIPKVDANYNYIKIYAIQYIENGITPEIRLIEDTLLSKRENLSFIDNGQILETVSLSQLLLDTNLPVIPNFITSKDNRLFKFNLKDIPFIFDIDMRAYSHNLSGECKLVSGVSSKNNILEYDSVVEYDASIPVEDYDYPTSLDGINPDFNTYKYQKNLAAIGGEGKYVKYRLRSINNSFNKNTNTFKQRDLERIGIIFYNAYGVETDVKWIADFKTSDLNSTLTGRKIRLEVEIKEEAFNQKIQDMISGGEISSSSAPVGYKIVKAEKSSADNLIIEQGIATPMITIDTEDRRYGDITGDESRLENLTKMPLFLARDFNVDRYRLNSPAHNKALDINEVHEVYDVNYSIIGRTFFDTRFIQIHSPGTVFDNEYNFSSDLELKTVGYINKNSYRFKRGDYEAKDLTINGKDESLYVHLNKNTACADQGGSGKLLASVYGRETDKLRWHQDRTLFTSKEETAINNSAISIEGLPEIAERGAGAKLYNGDSNKSYINTLRPLAGGRAAKKDCGAAKDYNQRDYLEGVMSDGARCITVYLEEPLENKFTDQGIPIVEITRPISYYYNGNMFNGISIQSRTRTTYIECSKYTPITENIVNIENPGTIFLGNFNLGRVMRKDETYTDPKYNIVSDTITYPVETSLNIYNRDDFTTSNNYIDITLPSFEEYYKYDKVYNQSNNFNKYFTSSTKFKSVDFITNKIIASKPKVIGEDIDSWVSDLENETMLLDGKYGDITGVANHNDEVYVLQNSAVSKLIINPRVQIRTDSTEDIQLGTGEVLYDYNYLTTKSGTMNKWSVLVTNNAFYYVDLSNKTLFKVIGDQVQDVSEMAGLHGFFQKSLDYEELKVDNPFINKGISAGYNINNQDAYFTFHQGDKSFTISHNNKTNSFTSLYDYKPSLYINSGDTMLTTNPDNTELWKHFTSNYGEFYNEYYPSYVIFQVTPDQLKSHTYDNINYQSEVYIEGVDQSDKSLTSIHAWNEYQNTGKINLVLGRNKNLRRKFREWNALIPRNQDSRDRIRNPWMFLKLEYDRNDNSKFILHDINIHYHD